MEQINVMPKVSAQLLKNAEDYGLLMMLTATQEQIENVIRQNDLFDQGLEICPHCYQESRRALESCEYCEHEKLTF